MKNKIIFAIFGLTFVGTANAATPIATEGFVHGAVDYAIEQANEYTDTEIAKIVVPDDTNMVHKTGNETIAGNKTFSNDIIVTGTLSGATGQWFESGESDGAYLSNNM